MHDESPSTCNGVQPPSSAIEAMMDYEQTRFERIFRESSTSVVFS